ncbi:PXA domain-containing protein [Dichomitus squalens]|uniref:PXA domain-containing protein n=1 Tax=Dichomitus squalens TaxID=114155 RepID=A0A4Q9N6W1_9APHY|nr:PXA domain-containing protein [Dichomitus squalens]
MTTVAPSASARRVGPRSIISPPPAKPVTLAKRILFPALPPDADLPPLLLSPAAAPQLNAELYDFIALALRAYVNTWWTKITRYDKEFLPEITRILTAVIRTLETRLLATDLSPLVFRDFPTVLAQHWIDYRNAQAKLHTSYAAGGAASLPQLFHQLQPHMAVSADGVIDHVYVRQAVDHILKVCLPPEDYEPEAERYIVREIILKVLVGGVLPRLTQPWFIHKLILDQLGPEKVAVEPPNTVADQTTTSGRPVIQRRSSGHVSFQALAILILSAVQSVSGVCLALLHAYKQARDTIKKVNQSKGLHGTDERAHPLADAQDEQHAYSHPRGETSLNATPSLPGTLNVPQKAPAAPSGSLPRVPSSESTSFVHSSSRTSTSSNVPEISPSPSPHPAPPPPPPIPDYAHPPLALLLTILTPPPSSAPAASSSCPEHASFATARALSHLLTLAASLASPFLARLLPYLLYTHVLSPATLANTVRSANRALFPEGWPAPPPVDPTPEEQAEMRETLRRRLAERVPGAVALLLGPTPAARLATVDAALAPLDDAACNAHLAVFILDLILLTVFPELGVKDEV